MRQRGLLVLLTIVVAGCGSVANEPADGSDPAVRPVDRPAPDAYTRWSQPSDVIVYWASYGKSERCEDEPETEPPSEGCKEYRELMQRAREEYRRAIDTVAPAEGTEPRVVAELDLDDGARSELISWRTSGDKLCTLARLVPEPEGWNQQQVVGECTPFAPCHETCVATLVRENTRLVLAGTLSRAAEAVRVTTAAGRDTLHVLSGPVLEDSDRRVFMLELSNLWRRLEVVADGRVIDTAEPEAGKTWDCEDCEEGDPADPE